MGSSSKSVDTSPTASPMAADRRLAASSGDELETEQETGEETGEKTGDWGDQGGLGRPPGRRGGLGRPGRTGEAAGETGRTVERRVGTRVFHF